jgi:hypothetical protein
MKRDELVRYLDNHRRKIVTTKGGWKIGKGVTSHEYSILGELVDTASFFQVMLLNITGQLPEKALSQWLEATFICLSWPDPRIWCNQIGSFGGTSKASPVASVCAGVLASDSSIYGPGTLDATIEFIANALKFVKNGGSVSEYVETKAKTRIGLIAPGFIRPIAKGDERIVAMQRVATKLDFVDGEHLQTAYAIEQYMLDHYDESLNMAGYMAAFLLDQGYSGKQIYRLCCLSVNGGIHACYAEAHDNPAETFLPLRCDDIEYVGTPPRSLNG